MLKHHRNEECIATAASKRRCSARIGVPLMDDDSLCHQATSIPLTPEEHQAVPLPSEISRQGYSSSTATMSPILACPRQYGRIQDTSTMEGGHIQSASQNDEVTCTSAALNTEKENCSGFGSDIRLSAADATSFYYDDRSSILRDESASYLSSLGNESHDPMQFASPTDIQWPETRFAGGMFYRSPPQDLIPVELSALHMQHMELNMVLEDEAWPKQSIWPIAQTNYYDNLAKPPEHVDGDKCLSCIIKNLMRMGSRLQNQTRRQLAEIKCSFYGSPSSLPL